MFSPVGLLILGNMIVEEHQQALRESFSEITFDLVLPLMNKPACETCRSGVFSVDFVHIPSRLALRALK